MNQTVTPPFRIADARRSVPFYIGGFGFQIDWEHRFQAGFPVSMQLTRSGHSIVLTEHTGDCQIGGAAYFVVPDVDPCDKDIVARGIVSVEPQADLPRGPRAMVVTNPDGNRLRVASPIRPTGDRPPAARPATAATHVPTRG